MRLVQCGLSAEGGVLAFLRAWSLSQSAGIGNLLDGQHPIWIADFTGAGHAQVMFYYAGDGNWCRKVWYLGQNGKADRNYFKNLQCQKLTKNKLCDRTLLVDSVELAKYFQGVFYFDWRVGIDISDVAKKFTVTSSADFM